MKNLVSLLKEVEDMFVHESQEPVQTHYDFILGKFSYGWGFSVVNSRQKWVGIKAEYQFGAYSNYSCPEDAVEAFLSYVSKKKIDVSSLMNKEQKHEKEK